MSLDSVERFSYFQSQWQDNNKRPQKTKIFIFIFFILIILFILFYFFIIEKKFFPSNRSVEVKINGLETAVAGQETDFTINVLNKENSELIDTQLIFNFPKEFKFISSEPNCQEKSEVVCVINLNKMMSGWNEDVKVKGIFFAENDKKMSLTARLSFRLENFSSWFKKEISQEVTMVSPMIDLINEGPDELMSQEEGIFQIKIKNNETKRMTTAIQVISQDAFNFINFQPIEAEEIEGGKQWKIILESNEEKQIDFSGYFSNEKNSQSLVARLGFLDEKNNFFRQAEKEIKVKISKPGLVLGLRINDSFLDEINQNFGEQAKISLSYKNISQDKIFEPSFKINIQPENIVMVDKKEIWQWFQLENNVPLDNFKLEKDNNSLSVNFSSSAINEINPGEEGEISFGLKIKRYEELMKEKPQDLKINLMAEVTAKLFKNQTLIFNVKSNQLNINVNSLVKLEAEARYFSDEGMKIGDGPLPPIVGETTSYFIYLRPINFNNSLNNILIVADLPMAVKWFGDKKVSQGNLIFDEINKKINWQINYLTPYAGGSYSFLEASFKIGLTPDQENKGQLMNLLENINFSANNGQVDFKIDTLTSNLINDDLGRGKGVVQ